MFSKANAKLEKLADVPVLAQFLENKRKVYSFDLLSGHSCPFAEKCLSKVKMVDGKRKIQDGTKTEFRCFSASQEVMYTNVYNRRNDNLQSLRGLSMSGMVDLISSNQPKNLGICRIHVAGDFFNRDYFNAWLQVAIDNPDRLYYAYTKSLPYWIDRQSDIPYNFVLTASRGGRRDNLITEHGLRESVVVYSEQEARSLGLEIDHDDSHAANPDTREQSFALLIHGVQPAGSEAAQAIKALKDANVQFSYSRKAKVNV
tara:strand:+ start:408 stop:1181 length:774 start_codon:yes stop_codon:yes gene_type:complete